MTEGKAEGKPADAESTAPHGDGGATAAPTGQATEKQEAAQPAAKPAAKSAGKSSGSSTERMTRDSGKEKESKGAAAKSSIDQVRSTIATVVWVAAVLCAVVLAAGALVVALDFNTKNSLVSFVIDTARSVDFGEDLKKFTPDGRGAEAVQSARTKTALVNWGIAAVVYLVGGKILDRVIRP